VVFSIPKIVRRYFLYDRKLLSNLSRCGWEWLKLYFKEAITGKRAVAGAVIAMQSFFITGAPYFILVPVWVFDRGFASGVPDPMSFRADP
jgi:hypothetical protein